MTRALLLGFLAFVLHGSLSAATLILPAAVAVRGDEITLGEVATIDGTPDEQTRIKAISLGDAPLIGQSRTYTQSMIWSYLQQQGVTPSMVTLDSPAAVRVTRLTTEISGDALLGVAQTWLQAQQPPADGEEVRYTPTSTPATLHVADGAVTYDCLPSGSLTGMLRMVQMSVLVEGKPVWRGLLGFRIQRMAPVLVAKTTITRGEAITPAQVAVEMRDISALSRTPLRDPAEVANRRAAQTINAGALLTTGVVETIPLVKRDAQVKVHAVCGAFLITTTAIACQDGALGDDIRVRNPQTRQEYMARVTGPGELALQL